MSSARLRLKPPRLQTLLLLVSGLILLLPLGGIAVVRLYENELIHRTEAELVAQGVVLREVYLGLFRRFAPDDGSELGRAITAPPADPAETGEYFRPIPPRIDLSVDSVLARPAESSPTDKVADDLALRAAFQMAEILIETKRTTLAGIRVLDSQGIVVASTGEELGHSLAYREEVARALTGENSIVLRSRVSDEPYPGLASHSRGKRYRVFAALPATENSRVVGVVLLSRTPTDITKALYLHRKPVLIGLAVVVLAAMAVTFFASWTIGRPVRALVKQAREIGGGQRAPFRPLAKPRTREVAELSAALVDMAHDLEERSDYIRTFASHVSHEFKTPLTSIRATAELLTDNSSTMTLQEREGFLANIVQASARLDNLVRRLRDLARADVLEPTDHAAEVSKAISAAVDRARAQGLTVRVPDKPSPTIAAISPEILDEILVNLLENIRQHAGDGAEAQIDLRLNRDGVPPTAEITVSDNGPGISDANADRIFTPFFTTARETGGSGLGLSIVRSLLASFDATIALKTGPGAGANFLIRLPLIGCGSPTESK